MWDVVRSWYRRAVGEVAVVLAGTIPAVELFDDAATSVPLIGWLLDAGGDWWVMGAGLFVAWAFTQQRIWYRETVTGLYKKLVLTVGPLLAWSVPAVEPLDDILGDFWVIGPFVDYGGELFVIAVGTVVAGLLTQAVFWNRRKN